MLVPPLGDDIGKELVLDRGDAVLDRQLALFQPFDEELVGGRGALEQDDLVVELAVLRPELDEFITELSLVDALHPAGPVNCSVLIHRASAQTIDRLCAERKRRGVDRAQKFLRGRTFTGACAPRCEWFQRNSFYLIAFAEWCLQEVADHGQPHFDLAP